MTEHLTEQDVRLLLADPSPASRAAVAAKIASHFEREPLSRDERRIAEDILRIMARDTVVLVRKALAENLKNAPALPRDVALMLARDVEDVALPVLEFSDVLTDTDLVSLVRSGVAAKQAAIARRASVPPEVADALIEAGDEDVVVTLMQNGGAEIGEKGYNLALDRFGGSVALHESMTRRETLPVTVAERLVTLVSDTLRDYLVAHHALPAALATDLVLQSRERATAELFSGLADEDTVEQLVVQLYRNGRLTPSLMLRALCMGDARFFEAGLALMAEVPLRNARLLIHDSGVLGFKSIYSKARLPQALFPAFRAALDAVHETALDGGANDIERYRRRLIERVLTAVRELGSDDLHYLMNKLGDLSRTAA